MRLLIITFLLFSIKVAKSQENYEIQVYGSQTQAKNSTIFELHSNFAFDGERGMLKGVRPSYHALHETNSKLPMAQQIISNWGFMYL